MMERAPDNPIYRRWNSPVETQLSDIHGWLTDIQSTYELLNRLLTESNSQMTDLLILDALSTSVVVRYCRCFVSGVRAKLSIEELTTATPAEIELHERVRAVRDRHVSHAVNEQEVHAIYVILDGSSQDEPACIGLSSQQSTDLPLQPEDLQPLLVLCEKWIRFLKKWLAREQAKLMPYVINLSRSELFALPQGEPQTNSNAFSKRTPPSR